MKLHLPKALFTAVLAALCSHAFAATYADWTITANETGQTVYSTTQNGAYDINLGAAAITTNNTQPYSITVLTTNSAGWEIPTGGVDSGLIVASTGNGSGNYQDQDNFTIRYGQTEEGTYQGKAWINNWGRYNTKTLTKEASADTITTLGATVAMDNVEAGKKLHVTTAAGSQLSTAEYLIDDANFVSRYNYATLSNKGLGLSDYSTVTTDVTVTKADNTVNGVGVGNLTIQDTSVVLNGTALNGTLTTEGTGSFSLTGTTNLSGLTASSSEVLYGETAEGASATGNGYAFGSYTYTIGSAGSAIEIAEGATFSNDDVAAANGTYSSSTGELSVVNSTPSGNYTINQGGTIDYSTGTAIASEATTGVTVNSASTLNMGAGTTLDHAHLTANENVTLDGSGLYIAGSATTLGDKVALADSWNGTVQLKGALNTGANFISEVSKNGSTVEMKGVTKWTSNWNAAVSGAVSQNILLTNDGNNAAWIYGAYYTDNSGKYESAYTEFSGTWSGTGNFMTNIDNSGAKGMRYKFTGDISQWTGAFKVNTNNASSVGIIEIGGDAHEVNAVIQRDSGILRVVVDTDTTFNQNINNATTLTINEGKTATLKQNLTITEVLMGAGSTLNMAGKNLRAEGASTLSNLTVQDLDFKQFGSKEAAAEGAYQVTMNGTNTVNGLLDMSRNAKTGASLLVTEGSSLTHHGDHLWMCNTNAGILLEEGATFSRKTNFSVTGLEDGGSIAWTNAGKDGTFDNLNQSNVTISNAALTVNSDQTISTVLDNVALTVNSGKVVTLSGTADISTAITNNGTLTVSGTVTYTGSTDTREIALTEGNGYGTTETYATVVSGSGTVTNSGTWKYDGSTVEYKDGDIITDTQVSSIYYVNDTTAGLNVVEGETFVINEVSDITVSDGTLDYGTITSGKTNVSSVTLSGETSGFKKGIFSLTGDGATLTPISGVEFDINQQGAKVSDGHATIANNGNWDITLYNELANVALTYTGTTADKTLKLNNTNTLTDVTMNNGGKLEIVGGETEISGTATLNDVVVDTGASLSADATKLNMQAGATATVNGVLTLTNAGADAVSIPNLVMGANSIVTVGTQESHDNALSLGSLAVTGAGAILNANLELADGSTLHMDATLTMGCSINLGEGITLEGNLLASLLDGSTDSIIIFTGLDSLTLNGVAYSHPVYASEVYSNPELVNTPDKKYVLSYNGSDVKLTVVPEPATATLSLLALAALAARRRRH